MGDSVNDSVTQALLDGSLALEQSSARARAWVGRMAGIATSVSSEEHSLLEATRRSENLARKLKGSSGRRNSAGVFGPSQAGKSYLVSVLGTFKGKPLMVDFAGHQRSFINEINPAGGKESTGLVTRFTIVPGTRDADFPVELRLLTETDLVKILGNSFLSDFDQNNRTLTLPDDNKVRSTIARLEGQARTTSAHLDEITMFDIGEYFRTNYSSAIGSLTNGGYWDALTRFGHRLPLAQRIELYALLWGSLDDITRIFKLLVDALEKLGHVPNARAVIDCLIPRERSIIDVDIVRLDLGTDEAKGDLLRVLPVSADGQEGRAVELQRATLCALVAELNVVMTQQPWDFFEHTDLLDFPGARSREQWVNLPSEADKRAESIRNMVRRGKVSYLFQRYTEERELACMLLCMPPKPAEVKDLTSLVRYWVAQTHGDKPSVRAKFPCALFFVLTWFDEELKAKPGDTPESIHNGIEARLEASMNGLYKQEEWLQNWADGKPFCNTYFLRNPAFPLEGVFEYEGEGKGAPEIGIRPSAKARMDAGRRGVVEGELSRRHFADPGVAWDAAVAFNDGGVRFLVQNLDRVLSPKLKTRQLVGRLVEQAAVIDGRLRRFYQADDDASRKEKEDGLVKLRRRLFQVSSECGFRNFVQLLARLKVAESEVRAVFLNVGSMRLDVVTAAQESPDSAKPVESDPFGDDDPWAEPTTAGSSAAAPPPVRQRDRYDHFATHVLNLWTERVRGLTTEATSLAALGIDLKLVGDIGNELVVGAHRNRLTDEIAEQVRKQVAAANLRWDEVADRCAGIATMLVNDFVAYLGYAKLPEAQRPGFPELPQPRTRAVFASPPMPAPGAIPDLGKQRVELERLYFVDWGVSFKQLGLDNVSFSGGREIGEEDNRELGQILADIVLAMNVSKLE